MFEVLIREATTRFNLGDKAQALLQMLLARMFNKDSGGLKGFLDLFINTGAAPQVQSWLGGGAGAQPLKDSQVEAALGSVGGLLSTLTERLDVSRDSVTSAIGYLLPPIIGKLTSGGGTLPVGIPDDVLPLVSAGQAALDAPPPAPAGGALLRWLPLLLLAALLALGLAFCNMKGGSGTATTGSTGTAAPAPAARPAPTPAATPASTPDAGASAAESKADAGSEDTAKDDKAGAGSEDAAKDDKAGADAGSKDGDKDAAAAGDDDHMDAVDDADGRPMLRVFFGSGKSAVPADFAERAAALKTWLDEHKGATVAISGFNDPTGNAAANEKLSRQRAENVRDALVTLGIAADRLTLEKPQDATDSDASLAQARRVEVTVRE